MIIKTIFNFIKMNNCLDCQSVLKYVGKTFMQEKIKGDLIFNELHFFCTKCKHKYIIPILYD